MTDTPRDIAGDDRYACAAGIELEETGPGYARARLVLGERHHNGFGSVHGGLLFTLADYVFAVACNSHGPLALAINASITFHQAVTSGVLVATCREVSLHRRLGHYEAEVRSDAGDLIARFQGTAYRKV